LPEFLNQREDVAFVLREQSFQVLAARRAARVLVVVGQLAPAKVL
jgi:hypothetical protein